jgi:hypothetical protein
MFVVACPTSLQYDICIHIIICPISQARPPRPSLSQYNNGSLTSDTLTACPPGQPELDLNGCTWKALGSMNLFPPI